VPVTSPTQLEQLIRFGLHTLGETNGHHNFERICLGLARRRIASNLIPATGPVSSGGDQGRDAESHWTNLPDELAATSVFAARASSDKIVLACTIQAEDIPTKIRRDLASICGQGDTVQRVAYFTVAPVNVSKRHELQDEAKQRYCVTLEIWDGRAIATHLVDHDLFHLAVDFLHLPGDLIPPAADGTTTLPHLNSWPLVKKADPIALGVHRARKEEGFSAIPDYVERDIDAQLRAELVAAKLEGGFVLLTGDSASGKTRTAFDAMASKLPECPILSPSRETELRQLPKLLSTQETDEPTQFVLWLDNLEGYLGSNSLDVALLDELVRSWRVVVIATMRDEQYSRFLPHNAENRSDTPDRFDRHSDAQVLNLAVTLHVPRLWTENEIKRAEHHKDPRLTEAIAHRNRHGIAEYLVAGPQLLQEWRQAARVGGHPRGAALVAVAVDLARTGLSVHASPSTLEELHHDYLRSIGGELLRPEPLTESFKWARTVRYGVSSLLLPGVGETLYPFSYLVDHAAHVPTTGAVPNAVWQTALNLANSASDYCDIANRAFADSRLDLAEIAWRSAAETGDPRAMASLSDLLKTIGRDVESAEWLLRAITAGYNPESARPVSSHRSSATYVAYWTTGYMSTCLLLGRWGKNNSDHHAKKWAESFVRNADVHLIPWQRLPHTGGWFTIDAISVDMYQLHCRSGVWELSKSLQRRDGVPIASDAELVAWASNVVRWKLREGSIHWSPIIVEDDLAAMYSYPPGFAL
jgi:hypothetical protein